MSDFQRAGNQTPSRKFSKDHTEGEVRCGTGEGITAGLSTLAPRRSTRTMHAQEPGTITTYSEVNVAERDLLAQWGFTAEEIASLLWPRQWYQNGGSDRATIVRYLEFLRLLVRSGELEL